MRSLTALITVASLTDLVAASGAVSIYNIDDPMYGTCRLKGITSSSENFKLYASVSSKDYTLNEACARCITVTRDDDPTKTTSAYVLDVCDGCASGTLKLSVNAMAALQIEAPDANTKVSFKFGTCPSSLMSGDIKACLMEGASATYVPLQIYNSQKVISGATIESVTATNPSSNFLYSANPGTPSDTWYQSIDFSVTSDDGETLNSTFAFTSKSGCATSDVQFNSVSTAEGVDSSPGSAGSSSIGAIIGGVVGAVAALFIIVGSVVLVRRHMHASKDNDDPENDVENQYLSAASKPKAVPVATYHSDQSHHDHRAPASPTADYAESFSPAAGTKAPGSIQPNAGPSVPAAAAPAPVSAAPPANLAAVASTKSPDHSVKSSPYSHDSSAERSPAHDPVYVAPTYSFSSNMTTSPHGSNAKAAPTLNAPVMPRMSSRGGFYDDDDDIEEERSSFDIDDMRETEARATDNPYAHSVTSPQSKVRATSLRRPGSKKNSMKMSELGRPINNSTISNGDSYASTAPRQTNDSAISYGTALQSNRSNPLLASDSSCNTLDSNSSAAGQQNADLSASLGSSRESGGYSRESLSILGYPYSKKTGRHLNSQEMQF